MSSLNPSPTLPADLEAVFSKYANDHDALLEAFMHIFCDHVRADRIFLQPRNPDTRVCKVLRWRRNDRIPWPAVPGDIKPKKWFVEDNWEIEDPLWRAAIHLKPSIYVEDLQKGADEGILNLEFESKYMFHTAFIHAHAHWPPLPAEGQGTGETKFYGSVQPAVFDGPRVWSEEIHELVDNCVVRIAPIMMAVGMRAPGKESLKG